MNRNKDRDQAPSAVGHDTGPAPADGPAPTEAALADLVARAQGGDEQAFGEIDSALRPALALRVRLRLSCTFRDRIDPDDILQETFLEAYRLLPGFSWTRNGCLLRWLEAIAEHQVQRAVRRRRRLDREVPLLRSSRTARGRSSTVIGLPAVPVPDASASQVALRKETLARVEQALQRLDPARREVVYLVHLKGLRVKEVAKLLGRSPQAIGVMLFRAVRQLRCLLRRTAAPRSGAALRC